MNTIFEINPTDEELKALFSYDPQTESMTYGFSIIPAKKQAYEKLVSEDEAILDLTQLLELRGYQATADKLWNHIPDKT